MRVVHCKREKFDVYIGRPGPYGNPYGHDPNNPRLETVTQSREEAIQFYENWCREMLDVHPEFMREDFLKPIAGKTLGCWCAPKPCHGDVLIKLCRELGLI